MNTKLTIENAAPTALLCTLELPLGEREQISITMRLPKNSGRTPSQLELQLLRQARDRLSALCTAHPDSTDA